MKRVVVGVEFGARTKVLKDWHLPKRLNELVQHTGAAADGSSAGGAAEPADILELVAQARASLETELPAFSLPFEKPYLELVGILLPVNDGTATSGTATDSRDDG